MENYYTLLGIAPDADTETIIAAYEQQSERYSVERVATLGGEFAQVARERRTAIDTAYQTLHDPAARAAYDQQLHGAAILPSKKAALTRRELTMLIGGAIVGLLLIATVWVLAGRSTTPTVGMAKLDRPAPAFSLTNIDGNDVQLDAYLGKKVVLVNFWYSKCEPCKEETPALQQAYQKLAPDGLVVIGINVRSNEQRGPAGEQDVRNFVQHYGVTYPIVFDQKGTVGRAYQVLPLPSSYFIDTTGTIRYASYSTLTVDDVERVFAELQRSTTATR